MKTFNTISEFKAKLQVGDKLKCIHHMDFVGRDENGHAIYADRDMDVREVSIKQTNSFALKTPSNGTFVDSWCEYPKAKECIIKDNKLTILEKDTRKFPGGCMDESNPDYANLPLIPVLTYEFV